jgi:calcium-translocating P-type ATPase
MQRAALSNPHHLTRDACLTALDARPGGLTGAEAQARQADYGPNTLPEAASRSATARFLSQFNNALICVLLCAAVVTAGLQHWVDTAVILAVVLGNAAIGFVQEGKAEAAMAALRVMLAPRAAAMRDGLRTSLDGADLVPGDVVLLEAGDRVPADLRILEARNLAVQEALLTGESLPATKSVHHVRLDAPLGDRRSMLWSGTIVAQGTAKGLVVATGAATEIGRVGAMLAQVDALTTPLIAQMDRFSRWLSAFILAFSAALLVYGVFVARADFADMFMAVVGLAVAAIPEGLPAVMTITLAIGVRQMAARNAIVRRLPAIEAIGSVSVICTDKTGTLTRNEMAVVAAATPIGAFTVTGEGYAPHGVISPRGDLDRLARAAASCNDARLVAQEGEWRVEGDPMEGALLAFACKAGVEDPLGARADAIPFDARHRFMAVLQQEPEGGVTYVKGAPERVFPMCAGLDHAHWRDRAAAMAAQGLRVLAFAERAETGSQIDENALEGGCVFLGLLGLMDPPRPEAVAAIAECQAAGIRIKMITGDHAGTAAAIAKAIGLANPGRVLTGADLDAMDDAALAHAAAATNVFARTSPEHKLRLVAALQSHGLSVAMTGDGVNDAPALKRADVGVAMGRKGSDAAKEASDLVLSDDNFASIAAAVREGRTVFDNLRKVIGFVLPISAAQACIVAVALLAGFPSPITPVQILWVNLITAITLGLALAFEPMEAGVMARPPRPRDAPVLPRELVWLVLFVTCLFLAACYGVFAYAQDRGYPAPLAQTLTMNALVALEIFYLFFVRSLRTTSLTWTAARGTRVVWTVVLAITAAQFAVTYLPPLQSVLGTAAVAFWDGVLLVAIGAGAFAILEIEKQIRLRLVRGRWRSSMPLKLRRHKT